MMMILMACRVATIVSNNHVSPQKAWNAFYKEGYNLQDSRSCEDPAWDEKDDVESDEVEEIDCGENKKMERSENADEDPKTNSKKSECPLLPADANLTILLASCPAGDLSFLSQFVKRFLIPLFCQSSVSSCCGDLGRLKTGC